MRNGTKKPDAPARPGKRGRPRAYDPQKALARAGAQFWRAGFAATSLDDLSAATGMNRPSLYGAFGDKQQLYLTALEQYRTAVMGNMARALDPARPLREGLAECYRLALLTYFSGPAEPRGCMLLGTAAVESPADATIRAALAKGLAAIDAEFERRFEAARKSGEIASRSDPALLARIAGSFMYMAAMKARSGESRESLEAFAAQALDFLMNAIRPAAKPKR